ncbi:MAG: ribonuclease R, partial [Polymorphobacter sp.]
MHRKSYPTGLPTPDQILDFIARTPAAVGKRDIAKAFGLHGADKIALKALLKDMADAGQLEVGAGRTVHKGGGLPKVAVLRVIEAGDDGAVGVPDNWSQPTPPPR